MRYDFCAKEAEAIVITISIVGSQIFPVCTGWRKRLEKANGRAFRSSCSFDCHRYRGLWRRRWRWSWRDSRRGYPFDRNLLWRLDRTTCLCGIAAGETCCSNIRRLEGTGLQSAKLPRTLSCLQRSNRPLQVSRR